MNKLSKLGLLIAIMLPTPALAADVTIGTANTENCYPYICGPGDSVTKYQQAFRGGAFDGPVTFDTLTYKVNKNDASKYDNASYAISFYYLASDFSAFSADFASNLGTSIGSFGVFELSGPVSSSLVMTGSTLTYDPSMGDLLMNVVITTLGETYGYSAFLKADQSGTDIKRAFASAYGTSVDALAPVTTFSLSSPAPAVPEPTTWALMIVGFGAMGAAMRRRPATRASLRAAA